MMARVLMSLERAYSNCLLTATQITADHSELLPVKNHHVTLLSGE